MLPDNYTPSERIRNIYKTRKDKGIKRQQYKIKESKQDSKIYRRYQYRANAKSLVFNLSLEEFNDLISKDCTYCGISNANTLDRINSDKGYTIDNVTSCCLKCNMMKSKWTTDEFISHIRKIYNHNISVNAI
jgi:hypothetical protein